MPTEDVNKCGVEIAIEKSDEAFLTRLRKIDILR